MNQVDLVSVLYLIGLLSVAGLWAVLAVHIVVGHYIVAVDRLLELEEYHIVVAVHTD